MYIFLLIFVALCLISKYPSLWKNSNCQLPKGTNQCINCSGSLQRSILGFSNISTSCHDRTSHTTLINIKTTSSKHCNIRQLKINLIDKTAACGRLSFEINEFIITCRHIRMSNSFEYDWCMFLTFLCRDLNRAIHSFCHSS